MLWRLIFLRLTPLDGETPTGFDVSVAREVANRLGLQLEIKAVPFDELVQGVHDGTYDVAISALSINPSRSGVSRFFHLRITWLIKRLWRRRACTKRCPS